MKIKIVCDAVSVTRQAVAVRFHYLPSSEDKFALSDDHDFSIAFPRQPGSEFLFSPGKAYVLDLSEVESGS